MFIAKIAATMMNTPWKEESELFAIARRELTSALLGDILDRFDRPHQFLPAGIGPVSPAMVIAGKVMTVLGADIGPEHPFDPQLPYGLLFEALDSLTANEVFVCTGGSPRYAIWGGLMSTRAQQLEAAGAVVNGCYRDTAEILELQFPTFGRMAYSPDQQSRGKIIDYRCPIAIGEVDIDNGDYIFGDRDGIVIIPGAIAQEVFLSALEKARTENRIRVSLAQGMSATEAFSKFGVF